MKTLSIQIIWSENGNLHNESIEAQGHAAKIFNSFDEFDLALIAAASMRTREGGYDKTKFIVSYGAEQYEGRFDLHSITEEQETSTGKVSLSQHIKDHCTWLVKNNSDFALAAQSWLDYLTEIEES
jgi:hypothetical protein